MINKLPRQTIRKPDDWHVHLRDETMMRTVLPYTAQRYGRALIMPNLSLPITTTERARAYKKKILAELPSTTSFKPMMTLYLTDSTDPSEVEKGHAEGLFLAAKLYPAHATTNAAMGVSDIQSIATVLERMQNIGMVLSIHGEVTDPSVDIFDREAVFIDRVLIPLRRNFPSLKIVLEHLTSRHAVDYIMSEGQHAPIAGTITAHHLHLNRNAIFANGLRPHAYCLPIAKREEDRQALISAATSGASMFFLGTDTAPHPRSAKETDGGKAGLFSAPRSLEHYAAIFDEAGALDRLEDFASFNGAVFYGLEPNKETITLEKLDTAQEKLKPILTEDGAEIIPFEEEAALYWRIHA